MRLGAASLCAASLRSQMLPCALTVILLALGLGTVVSALLIASGLESRLLRDARGIDAVVGAKGSPMQLVLSTVFHVDEPTGNIALQEARAIATHPLVAAAIPLALGDSFGGARIVGTTPEYVAHFSGALRAGRLWEGPAQAVLGSAVAERTGLTVGATIVGSHGFGGGFLLHEQSPLEVVGVLAPSDTVLDRLVLTAVESVWAAHGHFGEEGAEITALLVRYRSPIAAVTFPQAVNAGSTTQAASPARELTRLLAFVGVGLDVLHAFSAVLVLAAALSLFVALYRALEDQQHDLAVMRCLGASRARVLGHVLGQGVVLGVAGLAGGLALGHLAAAGVGAWLRRAQELPFSAAPWHEGELALVAGTFGVAILAALLPAWRAYRLDISRLLAKG